MRSILQKIKKTRIMCTNKNGKKETENQKDIVNINGEAHHNNNEAEIDQNVNASSDKFEK